MTPKLVAIGVAVSLVGGIGMLGLRKLDDSRPVTVDEAVDRFRSATPSVPGSTPSAVPTATRAPSASATASPTASPGTRPGVTAGPTATATRPGATAPPPAEGARTPAGVYTYRTTGYETADAGVPRARHDYPAETTVTVRDLPCGSSVRWDATEDRWDDVTVCVGRDHTKVTSYVSYHRFFGQSETRSYRCSGDSYLRPPTTRAGYRWTFDCVADDARARTTGRVVGIVTVNGTRALHVHYDSTLTGSVRGTNPQDFWIALDGPYVVRQASRVDAEVDSPFGGTVTYHEQYDLVLKSRTPRR